MRILVVIKRYSGSIGKDAIGQDFGREIRLAAELAKKNTVTVLAGDHITKENRDLIMKNMQIHIRPFSIRGMLGFVKEISRLGRAHDVVIGTTHPLFALMTHRGSKRFVYDLRDNYETYDLGIPLLGMGKMVLKRINNHLIKKCVLAVCVSESLKEKVMRQRKGKTIVVENGVSSLFKPLDQKKSREKHKLPLTAPILIYTGHISKERGAVLLMKAFEKVKEKEKDAILLLSGKVEKGIGIKQPGIVYKTFSERQNVVEGISAADIAVLPQPFNATTKYTFPYKLMEYLACDTAVVATGVGDVKRVLPAENLAKPDPDALADTILRVLHGKKQNYRKLASAYSWEKLARRLQKGLEALS